MTENAPVAAPYPHPVTRQRVGAAATHPTRTSGFDALLRRACGRAGDPCGAPPADKFASEAEPPPWLAGLTCRWSERPAGVHDGGPNWARAHQGGDNPTLEEAQRGACSHEPAQDDEGSPEPSVPIDPLVAALTVPVGGVARATPAAVSAVNPALDQIALQLVRRFSAGTSHRGGTVRLEFGAGALSGTSVVVTSDAGALSVSVDAPPGIDAESLARRLRQRLEDKGLRLEALECR